MSEYAHSTEPQNTRLNRMPGAQVHQEATLFDDFELETNGPSSVIDERKLEHLIDTGMSVSEAYEALGVSQATLKTMNEAVLKPSVTIIEDPTPGASMTLAERSSLVHDALDSIAYINQTNGARSVAADASHARHGKVSNRIDGMEAHAAAHREKLALTLDALIAKKALREAGFDESQIRTAADETMLELSPAYRTGSQGSRNRQKIRKKVSDTEKRSR